MEETKYGPYHKDFAVDMTFLWDILHCVFGGTAIWEHAKYLKKSRTGNMCYLSSRTYFLVCSMPITQPPNSSSICVSSPMIGRREDSPFKTFVVLHKGQHIISDRLIEYGYSGVDDNSRVCMLMNSINTNACDACKSAILDSP